MASIPTIDSLDVAWVSAQVGITNAVSMTKVKVGNGAVASCYRLTISMSDGSCHTFIAKCPSENHQTRHTARMAHLYENEVSFYRYFASCIPIRTPKCYFAQGDEDDNFLLLLEDLSPSAVVDPFAGVSLEVAKAGLRSLAGLHGYTCMKSEFLQSPRLRLESEEAKRWGLEMILATFGQFVDLMDKKVDEATLKTLMLIKEHLHLLRNYSPPKPCLIHRDFHTDNLLIGARNGEVLLAAIDWQSITVGSPMIDVAYFLVSSLTTEDCANYENVLIDFYIECLRDYGVEYPRELARREFAIHTLEPIMTAAMGTTLAKVDDKVARFLNLFLERGIAAATRWNALKELKQS